jgi:hypothetical protein
VSCCLLCAPSFDVFPRASVRARAKTVTDLRSSIERFDWFISRERTLLVGWTARLRRPRAFVWRQRKRKATSILSLRNHPLMMCCFLCFFFRSFLVPWCHLHERPWPTFSHYYFLLQIPRLHPPCDGNYSLVHPCGWPRWQRPLVELWQPFLPVPGLLYHPPPPVLVVGVDQQPFTRSPQRQPHSHPKPLVSFRQKNHRL